MTLCAVPPRQLGRAEPSSSAVASPRRQALLRAWLGPDEYDRFSAPLTARTERVALSSDAQLDSHSGVTRNGKGEPAVEAFSDFDVEAREQRQRRRRAGWSAASRAFCCLRASAWRERSPSTPRTAVHTAYSWFDTHIDCLYRVLQRVQDVQELAFDDGQHRANNSRQLKPMWDWTRLQATLPHLPTLRLCNVAVKWQSVLQPMLTATAEANLNSEDMAAVQLRLQIALSAHVLRHLRTAKDNGAPEGCGLEQVLQEAEGVDGQLQARQQAADEQPRAKRARVD